MKSIIVWLAIITISLTLTVQTYAEIDLETARGIWLLDEGDGDVINDMSGNEKSRSTPGRRMDQRTRWSRPQFKRTR